MERNLGDELHSRSFAPVRLRTDELELAHCWQVLLVRVGLGCTTPDVLAWLTALVPRLSQVGIVAIFYQKGIPQVVTQGYLVAVSSVMAWQVGPPLPLLCRPSAPPLPILRSLLPANR
jgi:hypothetical protein